MYLNFSRTQKIIIGILLVIIVITIPTAIYIRNRILLSNTNFSIQNFDSLATNKPPISEKTAFYENVHYFLTYQNNLAEDTLINDVVVRDSTFSESRDGDSVSYYFIIDIDSLQQSYIIDYTWSTKEFISDGLTISCPAVKDMIYTTYCIGMYDNTISATLATYPATKTLDSTIPYTVYYDFSHPESDARTVIASTSVCDDNTLSRIKSTTESYLTTLGLSSYNITVTATCN